MRQRSSWWSKAMLAIACSVVAGAMSGVAPVGAQAPEDRPPVTVGPDEVLAGQSVTVSNVHPDCVGVEVIFTIEPYLFPGDLFGNILTDGVDAGRWSTSVVVPEGTPVGTYTVDAWCAAQYAPATFEVVVPTEPTEAPVDTSVDTSEEHPPTTTAPVGSPVAAPRFTG
jgi:hypothetical protein